MIFLILIFIVIFILFLVKRISKTNYTWHLRNYDDIPDKDDY